MPRHDGNKKRQSKGERKRRRRLPTDTPKKFTDTDKEDSR